MNLNFVLDAEKFTKRYVVCIEHFDGWRAICDSDSYLDATAKAYQLLGVVVDRERKPTEK